MGFSTLSLALCEFTMRRKTTPSSSTKTLSSVEEDRVGALNDCSFMKYTSRVSFVKGLRYTIPPLRVRWYSLRLLTLNSDHCETTLMIVLSDGLVTNLFESRSFSFARLLISHSVRKRLLTLVHVAKITNTDILKKIIIRIKTGKNR